MGCHSYCALSLLTLEIATELSDVSWQSVSSANYRMCQLALPIQIAMSTIIILIYYYTNGKWMV